MQGFVWNIDPVLIRLGPLHVRYYGVCFALTIILGYSLFERRMVRQGYSRELAAKFLLYAVAGLTIGARLGHCLFYHPRFFLGHPLEMIKVWEGGLASHGATIGLLAAGLAFAAANEVPFLAVADAGVFAAAVGAVLVRVGNFFNSEILGRAASVPWAVTFLRRDAVPRHPSQLYEALGGLWVLGLLFLAARRLKAPPPGVFLGLFLASYFTFRFLVEFVKEYHTTHHGFLTMGQYLSLPFLAAGLAILAVSLRRSKSDRVP